MISGLQKNRISRIEPTPRVTKMRRLPSKSKSPAGMEERKEMNLPVNGLAACPPCVCPESMRFQS